MVFPASAIKCIDNVTGGGKSIECESNFDACYKSKTVLEITQTCGGKSAGEGCRNVALGQKICICSDKDNCNAGIFIKSSKTVQLALPIFIMVIFSPLWKYIRI